MTRTLPDRGTYLATLALCAVGIVAILYGTRWGPWAGSDSVEYFEAARNLADGKGLVLVRASGAVRPLSLRPPLYPILLALGNQAGADLLVAAKIIGTASFVLFAGALGIGLSHLTKDAVAGPAVVLLVATSATMFELFLGAMSEPPFFAFAALAFVLALSFIQSGRVAILVLSGGFAGLALLTRYAGAWILVTNTVALIVFRNGSLWRRLRLGSSYFLLSALPFAVWVLQLGRSETTPGVYNSDLAELWGRLAPFRIAFVDVLWNWLPLSSSFPDLTYRQKLYGLLLLLAVGVGLVTRLVLRSIRASDPVRLRPVILILVTAGIGIFTYSVFIAGTYLLVVVPRPAIVPRILSPILVQSYVVAPLLLLSFSDGLLRRKVAGPLVVAITLFIARVQLPQTTSLLADLHWEGGGYSSREWQSSEVISALSGLPQEVQLISNDIDGIMFYLNRPAFRVPELESGKPTLQFRPFGKGGDNEVERTFREEGAALVLIEPVYWQFEVLYKERTEERLEAFTRGLPKYFSSGDGAIYFYEPKE